MKPVSPQFVQSIVENYGYGSEEGVKHQTQKEAEASCEKHDKAMKDFGMPKNVGNAYKAPENPQPREQSLNDDQSKSDSLTENAEQGYPEMGIKGGTKAAKKEAKKRKYKKKQMLQDDSGLVGNQDELDVDGDGEIEGEDLAKLRAGKKKEVAMESRVEALEESLATLLTSLKSLINEGYGKKMMKEDEGNVSLNPGKQFIKQQKKPKKTPTHITVQGKKVPLKKLKKNLSPEQYNQKVIQANAQQMDSENDRTVDKRTGQKKKQMSKQEIKQAVEDN